MIPKYEAFFNTKVPQPSGGCIDHMFATSWGFRRANRQTMRRSNSKPTAYMEDKELFHEAQAMPSYMQSFND